MAENHAPHPPTVVENDQGIRVVIGHIEEPNLPSYYAAGGNSLKHETKAFVGHALTFFACSKYTEHTTCVCLLRDFLIQ